MIKMTKSFAQISSEVDKILDNAVSNIQENVLTEVQQKTPVDTGTARKGWVKLGSEIRNDVPYIGYIEEGSLKHRPIGMVKSTLMDIELIVNNSI